MLRSPVLSRGHAPVHAAMVGPRWLANPCTHRGGRSELAAGAADHATGQDSGGGNGIGSTEVGNRRIEQPAFPIMSGRGERAAARSSAQAAAPSFRRPRRRRPPPIRALSARQSSAPSAAATRCVRRPRPSRIARPGHAGGAVRRAEIGVDRRPVEGMSKQKLQGELSTRTLASTALRIHSGVPTDRPPPPCRRSMRAVPEPMRRRGTSVLRLTERQPCKDHCRRSRGGQPESWMALSAGTPNSWSRARQ